MPNRILFYSSFANAKLAGVKGVIEDVSKMKVAGEDIRI